MQIFIYNMDRQNDGLVRSLEDLLVKKQELLSFGRIESDTIIKNNGYLITDASDQDSSVIWTAIKMIAKGCSVSYWITDYGTDFKFITLKKTSNEFKKLSEKKVVIDNNTANDIINHMTDFKQSPTKKGFKKLEKIKLVELTPSEDFTLDVKFNPNKSFSLAQVNRENKLIKIPEGAWIVIRGSHYKTNNDEVKNILESRRFIENEDLPSIE